jgi:Ca-activated chloride channel homolog
MLDVRIERPAPGQAVFGPTEVKLRVESDEAIARIDLFVNGERMGVITGPPYEVIVDVGEQNVRREFRVEARTTTGTTVGDSVLTLPVEINDEMDLSLRQLYVTVTRGSSRVLELGQEDFQVYDDGRKQEIVTFGRGELPLTAVLLLDTSESMQGERLEAARRGARAFLGGMRPLDEARVVLFSDRLLQVTPFLQDTGALSGALEEVHAAGGTAVNDYLYASLALLEARQGRRVVILLSDGSDIHSALPMESVLWKARTSQALIYWIRLGLRTRYQSFASSWRGPEQNSREYQLLEKAVLESGGRIEQVERVDDLEGAFRGILQELREQFVLGYYPGRLRKDGSWHKIRVDVRGPGLNVRTRDGYMDE